VVGNHDVFEGLSVRLERLRKMTKHLTQDKQKPDQYYVYYPNALKDLEGSNYGVTKVLYWHIPGEGSRKNHDTLSQNNQYPSRDSNKAPPEYKSRMLLIHQSAQ
jgi:hypothetical protein